jgi:HPt (histidine-containing phosphotransfer) domain-containing protein
LSGNIGAQQLQMLCAEVETLLHQHADLMQLSPLLGTLDQVLQKQIASIQHSLSTVVPTTTHRQLALSPAVLNSLYHALEEGNADVADLINAHANALRLHLGAGYDPFVAEVDAYNFEAALTLLSTTPTTAATP